MLAQVALESTRPTSHRLRALSLLRPARWLHLAILLEAHNEETDNDVRRRLSAEIGGWSAARVTRKPEEQLRARIERLLPSIDPHQRRAIEFVLRTSS